MNNIKETIRQLAQGGRQSVSLVCTVDVVDKTARTVDCTPLDESAPLLGVNLQANQESTFGVVAFPKVGSYVVVGFVADGAAGVVLLTDEVESVEVVISGDTARISADKDGVRVLMGDDTSVELMKEGVILNGGGLGGIVKVEQLTEHFNAIENDINELKNIFSAWVAVPQDGGAALSALTANWAGNLLTPTQRGDYENEKVKHG
ncbi:MAG: hypothetical protein V8T07_03005 [Muribaculaceae bacterium]